jgi:hypothetical protein
MSHTWPRPLHPTLSVPSLSYVTYNSQVHPHLTMKIATSNHVTEMVPWLFAPYIRRSIPTTCLETTWKQFTPTICNPNVFQMKLCQYKYQYYTFHQYHDSKNNPENGIHHINVTMKQNVIALPIPGSPFVLGHGECAWPRIASCDSSKACCKPVDHQFNPIRIYVFNRLGTAPYVVVTYYVHCCLLKVSRSEHVMLHFVHLFKTCRTVLPPGVIIWFQVPWALPTISITILGVQRVVLGALREAQYPRANC